MDLKEIGIDTRNWVDLAHVSDYLRALVNAALNLRVLKATELVTGNYVMSTWRRLPDSNAVESNRPTKMRSNHMYYDVNEQPRYFEY